MQSLSSLFQHLLTKYPGRVGRALWERALCWRRMRGDTKGMTASSESLGEGELGSAIRLLQHSLGRLSFAGKRVLKGN